MIYEVKIGTRTARVEVRRTDDGYQVAVDGGPPRSVGACKVGRAEWMLTDASGRRSVSALVEGDRLFAQVEGFGLSGEIVDPREHALHSASAGARGLVRSPMPGAVVRVVVAVGDRVHQGQVLVVVEAMKMENEFRAPIDGVVSQIAVKAGATIESNTTLVVVEPA